MKWVKNSEDPVILKKTSRKLLADNFLNVELFQYKLNLRF